jgi:hypothetical protein
VKHFSQSLVYIQFVCNSIFKLNVLTIEVEAYVAIGTNSHGEGFYDQDYRPLHSRERYFNFESTNTVQRTFLEIRLLIWKE